MRFRLRVAWTLALVALHIAVALMVVGLLFPLFPLSSRLRFVRWWSGRVLIIFGLQRTIGRPIDHELVDRALRPGGIGAMLVMNHVSWLDIFVVHSLRPARFVAKAEIARWPLLGFLTDRSGAVFIERGKRHAVRDVNRRIAEMLAAGDLVGVFPEGAVGDGGHLLPFHANLIQPAIDAAVPVVIGALRYRDLHGRRTTAIDYAGDVTLLESILRIARHGPLVVDLHLLDVLDAATMTRHEVARTARALIGAALGDAVEAVEAPATVIVAPDEWLSPGVGTARTEPGTTLDPRDGAP